MVRKIFALASVSALAGIISAVSVTGCSDDPPPGNDPGTPDAGTDAKKPPKTDGGDDDDVDAGDQSCMTKDAIDETLFPYKKARVQAAGTCSTDEAAALRKYVNDLAGAQPNVDDWKASVGAACAACVFSDGSEDSWSPIIVKDDKVDVINTGGCLEALGASTACGAAYQRVNECITEACSKECTTQAAFDECRQNITAIGQGPCRNAFAKLQADCSDLGTKESTCFPNGAYFFEGSIKYLCVEGSPDGGDGGDGG